MQELKGRFVESLQRIKEGIANRSEQKIVQENRLGEDAPDVTLSPDYSRINDKSEQAHIKSVNEKQSTRKSRGLTSFDVKTVAGRYEITKKPDDFLE